MSTSSKSSSTKVFYEVFPRGQQLFSLVSRLLQGNSPQFLSGGFNLAEILSTMALISLNGRHLCTDVLDFNGESRGLLDFPSVL